MFAARVVAAEPVPGRKMVKKGFEIIGIDSKPWFEVFRGQVLQSVYLRRRLQSQADGPETGGQFHVLNNHGNHVQDQKYDDR